MQTLKVFEDGIMSSLLLGLLFKLVNLSAVGGIAARLCFPDVEAFRGSI